MICQWHLVKKFGCKFSLSMACSHWPTIWLLKGGWGGGGGYGWFGLGKNFFPNLWWQNFFSWHTTVQDFISNITRTLYFQCRNFFFCQLFLATFFSLTISLQDIFLWNHPYPLLKVKWSIPNPNWPHCCQCSMLTCSVLTRPQHCGIAALPKGSQGRKEGKQTYYKVYVTIRTHTYISLWYEPKFNWLQRLYKTPIFISLILRPVKMLS